MLSEELAAFVESGVTILVAARSAELRPDCTLAAGARALPSRDRVILYLPEATSQAVVRDLADNGRIAVTFSRAVDHMTIQLKGRAEVRPARDNEKLFVDAYHASLGSVLAMVGYPLSIIRRINFWPAFAVEIAVESLFHQTPGSGTGAPI